MSLLPRNVFISFATQAVPMVVAVASVPVVIHFLGTESVGLLSMIWVLISYFSVLDIGISAAITRSASIALASEQPESLRPLFWSAAMLQLTMGTIGACVLLAAAPFLATNALHIPAALLSQSVLAIRICALGLPVVLLSGSVTGVIQAASRFDVLAKIQLPISAAQYAFPALLAWLGATLPAIVVVLVALRVAALLLTVRAAMRLFPWLSHPAAVQWSQLRGLLSFGVWIMVSAIISPFLVYVDRFLIANRLTLADVAYYAVPLDAVMRLLLFSSSLSMVLYPAFSSTTSTSEAGPTNTVVRASLKYVLCCTGIPTILILVFSHDIMRVWINPGFADHSAQVLRILAVGVMANAVARIPYSLLQSQGYPNITALLQMASLPLQVAVSLYLMSTIGVSGAAVAWSGRLVIETVFLFYFANWRCGLSIRRTWIENTPALLTLAAIFVAAAILAYLAGPDTTIRAVSAILVAASGAVLAWLYALNARDRSLIRNCIKWGNA